MNLSSPSPLDSILPSHPLYNNYEEENMFPLETKLDPSALKSVFSASPFPSQSTSSKPLSKKKASKRRSQVKNACVNCQRACKKCDEGRPCQRCIKLGITDTCINSPRKERKKGFKRGPYRKKLGTVPQRIVSKKDLVVSQPVVVKIEETTTATTNNYVPTYVSPIIDQWSQSPQYCDEASVPYDIESENIAEQRFYNFYSKSSVNYSSSFDSVCQPKSTTTTNNRVNNINNTVAAVELDQYNPLMVQRQSFSSDEYGIYPDIEPSSQDYLSPINYDYSINAVPGNFGYTNNFDVSYQYDQPLVPKLQATTPMVPPTYNIMTDMSNTFSPYQNLYANKNQYYVEDQNYYVEKATVYPNTNQWFGKSEVDSQHSYYNNQLF